MDDISTDATFCQPWMYSCWKQTPGFCLNRALGLLLCSTRPTRRRDLWTLNSELWTKSQPRDRRDRVAERTLEPGLTSTKKRFGGRLVRFVSLIYFVFSVCYDANSLCTSRLMWLDRMRRTSAPWLAHGRTGAFSGRKTNNNASNMTKKKKSILLVLPNVLMFNMRVLYYNNDYDYSCAISCLLWS